MFICSVRAGTLRFICVVCAALFALTALVFLIPSAETAVAADGTVVESNTVSFENIESNENRIAFLSAFGWTVDPTPIESASVTIPTTFDKVFSAYNEMQRTQGLDLSGYCGKTVERYTYTITNYANYDGTVLANLLICRGRVIGGDVCSADSAGFIHGFERPN